MIADETEEVHKGSPSQMFFKMQLASLKISGYSQEKTCWSRPVTLLKEFLLDYFLENIYREIFKTRVFL